MIQAPTFNRNPKLLVPKPKAKRVERLNTGLDRTLNQKMP